MINTVSRAGFIYDEKMEYIIKKQRKISVKSVETLKITFDILCELHEKSSEHIKERLGVAYIIYKYNRN